METRDAPDPPRRHPDAPAPGTPLPCHFHLCYGCGEHPLGLRMQLFAGAGVAVEGKFVVTEHHQGAPGLAHGGLLAASMDELLGSLNWLLMAPAVTAKLEVDFCRPVPVGTELGLRAEVTGTHGRKIFATGEARFEGGTGDVAFRGAGLFVQVPPEHFTRHGREEDVAAAKEVRADGGVGQPWLEVNP